MNNRELESNLRNKLSNPEEYLSPKQIHTVISDLGRSAIVKTLYKSGRPMLEAELLQSATNLLVKHDLPPIDEATMKEHLALLREMRITKKTGEDIELTEAGAQIVGTLSQSTPPTATEPQL